MEAFLNELSLLPKCDTKDQAKEKIHEFLLVSKELKKCGCNVVRCNSDFWINTIAKRFSFSDYLNDSSISRTQQSLLLGLIKCPFLKDESDEENEYILSEYKTKNQNNEIVNPEGLAAASICNEPTISFSTDIFWEKSPLELTIIPNEGDEFDIPIQNFWNINSVSEFLQEQLNQLDLNSEENIYKLFNRDEIIFEERALKEFIEYFYDDIRYQRRIIQLINDINDNPFTGGLGKTEILKGQNGMASKRVVKKDRLIYTYTKKLIIIHQCKEHYEDK